MLPRPVVVSIVSRLYKCTYENEIPEVSEIFEKAEFVEISEFATIPNFWKNRDGTGVEDLHISNQLATDEELEFAAVSVAVGPVIFEKQIEARKKSG